MRALPNGDPRSWNSQAGIHGTVNGGFNFCQHGTDHFFSWHRAYLFYFEQICQELTGDDSFGLPYWNWNQNPEMHSTFTAGGSPLNHPRVNTTVGNDSAFSDDTLDGILGDSNFFSFSDQLEGTPHNMTHIIVGADMVSGGSPQDPIFYPHHCMVDYCWAKWNLELGNDNTNNQAWLNTSWNHFVNGQGTPVNVTAGTTILMPLLSYRYETSAIGSSPASLVAAQEDFKKLEKRLRTGAEVEFEVKSRLRIAERTSVTLSRPFSKEIQAAPRDFAGLLESGTSEEQLFLSIDWANLPQTNDFYVRVFINLPSADRNTSTDNPHYAGSFAFFGTHMEGHEGHGKTDFLVNATETLRRLNASGDAPASGPLSVQLVAVPVSGNLDPPDAELILNNVDLIATPVFVRSN